MDPVLHRLAEARPFAVPPRPGRGRARPSRKLVLLPAGALAAAVAVVAAIPLAGGGAGQSPAGGDQHATPVRAKDARQVLLAAATRMETAQPSTGRYWWQRLHSGHVYDVGGYYVMGRIEQEVWSPFTAQDSHVQCSRWLGFQPVTEADRAAWVRAGSPATVESAGKKPTRTLTLEAGQRECRSRPGNGDDRFYVAGVEYSLEQLRALPTDPVQLRATLSQAIPDVDAELLFLAASDILVRTPSQPALQAAAYRMLADLPGISFVEGVTDILGRTGSGVDHSFRSTDPAKFTIRLVIDLSTGQHLAYEQRRAAGALVYSDAVVSSELTDQTPPPPSA
jgi:hypothetical protein